MTKQITIVSEFDNFILFSNCLVKCKQQPGAFFQGQVTKWTCAKALHFNI